MESTVADRLSGFIPGIRDWKLRQRFFTGEGALAFETDPFRTFILRTSPGMVLLAAISWPVRDASISPNPFTSVLLSQSSMSGGRAVKISCRSESVDLSLKSIA